MNKKISTLLILLIIGFLSFNIYASEEEGKQEEQKEKIINIKIWQNYLFFEF